MIPSLQPIFQGPWARYGETLALTSEDTKAFPVKLLLTEKDLLNEILNRHAKYLGVRDPRPVASSWLLSYCTALLPPIVAATTLLQLSLPVGINDLKVELNIADEPAVFYIDNEGDLLIGDTYDRYHKLIWENLSPLIKHLSDHSRIPAKVLWGNVARRLEPIFEQALIFADTHAPSSVREDFEKLLFTRLWNNDFRNPLYQLQKTSIKKIPAIKLHRQCCLFHLIPNEGYCDACPLSPKNL